MYPSGQLSELATRKALLQARIAVRRWECAAAAAEVARPIALVDRGVELWHRISPLVKTLLIPGGILLAQFLRRGRGAPGAAKQGGKMAAVMAALPMIMHGIKIMQEMRATKEPTPEPASGKAGV